jgi:hypothetical protein
MTDPKIDMRKLFQKELDKTLFDSLEFHSVLKEEVRNKLKTDHISKMNQPWLTPIWKKWLFSTLAAAAVICLFFLSTWMISGDDTNQSDPKTVTNDPANILRSDGDNSNLISGPNEMKSWDLVSENEAKQSFGNDLQLPMYIPMNFKLDRLHGFGKSREQLNKVIFTYIDGEKSYLVIMERSGRNEIPLGFIKVDINGTTGYLKKQDGAENLDAELHWYLNGIHYMVGGLITSQEAIKIALSFN